MKANSTMRRAALITGGAAIVAMGLVAVGNTINDANDTGPLALSHVDTPRAPGSSGGEVTRGIQSGSFAPTSTNDLMTPVTPTPGSPWRD